MTNGARAIIHNSRNAQGKVDVRLAIHNMVAHGHSEFEAAAHLVAFGCPADLAYSRAADALAAR